MKVVVYGANGAMGPYVVKALEREHELRLSDVNDLEGSPHEYRKIDVADIDAVVDAAEGMDVIWEPLLNAIFCWCSTSESGPRSNIQSGMWLNPYFDLRNSSTDSRSVLLRSMMF